MRAYPKGLRVSSSNLDPAPFWRQGVQMVALNWQNLNAAMMLNHAMFASTGGWVLKPAGYRDSSTASASSPPQSTSPPHVHRGALTLAVEVFAVQNLSPESSDKKIRPYIRSELHVEPVTTNAADAASKQSIVISKDGEYKVHSATGTSTNGGRDADFSRQVLRFPTVQGVLEELSFLRLKVMDDDPLRPDQLVAWACFKVSRLGEGVRVVRLRDENGEETEGLLLVKFGKKFVVDSHTD